MAYREETMTIDRICRWDDRSVEWVYDHFYKALTLISLQVVADEDVAEDVVQDFFTRLLEQQPMFENVAHLKAYFYNGVRNLSISHQRHEKVKDNYTDQVKQDALFQLDSNEEEPFFTEEIYRQLFLAIDHLPRRQREIFLLAMQGKTNAEIAGELGLALETVKTLKKRGKKQLRETLAPEALLVLFCLV